MPPSNYSSIVQKGVSHVLQQSSTARRKERVLIVGEMDDFEISDLATNSKRVVFLKSPQVTHVLQGETHILDGRHLAAIYAGKASSLQSIVQPVTGKNLTGFDFNERSKKK